MRLVLLAGPTVLLTAVLLSAPPAAAAATATPDVSITLTSMTPRSPEPTPSAQKVTFDATVTNNTDTAYSDIQLALQRGVPATTRSELSQLISAPLTASATTNINPNPVDLGKALPAHSSIAVSYISNPDSDHMCLCNTGVYPFALTVLGLTSDGGEVNELARTQVLVPSFLSAPAPIQVGWVWPLIDRPHRTLSDTVFTDDDLAQSVAAGGRLDRALRTAELATDAGVHLSLVVDPELLDSLAVMQAGYQVREGAKTLIGTGGELAKAWLARFIALQARQDVVLTGYADPDVDAITRANLLYSTALTPQVQARLAPILGSGLASNVYWPAGGAMTTAGLNAAVAAGAAAVILSDQALPSANSDPPPVNALSPLPSASGQATALVTDSGIQATVTDALKNPTDAASDEQILLSQLAIQAASDPSNSHFNILAPDRYVNPADPVSAAALMSTITQASWGSSVTIPQALRTVAPSTRAGLVTAAAKQSQELDGTQLSALAAIENGVSSLRTAFGAAEALTLLGDVSGAFSRAQSNFWRLNHAGLSTLVTELQQQSSTISSAVHLVQPTNGTYSLSSQDSPVVVTVENPLAQPVTVQIRVAASKGVLGFQASPLDRQVIQANSKSTISIPTHTDRLGKFKVVATLSTPDGYQLGQAVPLTLRVTAIGGITKAITGLAGGVLVLALVRRFYRRMRGARAKSVGTA